MQNNFKLHRLSTLILVFILFLGLFALVNQNSDFLPYQDENVSYYIPAHKYFENEQYKIWDNESFIQSFGQPPIFQIYIWTVNKLSANETYYSRITFFCVHALLLLSLMYLLVKYTSSYLIGLFFLFMLI